VLGVESEVCSVLTILKVCQETLISQVERMRVFPVVVNDLVQPFNHVVVTDFNCQFAAAVETTRGQVDRANDGADSIGKKASWHEASDV